MVSRFQVFMVLKRSGTNIVNCILTKTSGELKVDSPALTATKKSWTSLNISLRTPLNFRR